jgi:predicted metal-dependent hydrolase
LKTNGPRLRATFRRVNKRYFGNYFNPKALYWVQQQEFTQKLPGRRLWAQCHPQKKTIYIFLGLRSAAPDYVLEFLLYHECLHFFWLRHCPRFRAEEKKFREFKNAALWLERHEFLAYAE